MKRSLRDTLRLIGPYPYNPKLMFLFFVAFYFSRFVPTILEKSEGRERISMAFVVMILAATPAAFFAGGAFLLQKFRFWSPESLIFYIGEVILVQTLLFFSAPTITAILNRFFRVNLQFPMVMSFGLAVGSTVLVLVLLAVMHNAERGVVERLRKADELISKLEADRRDLIFSDEELRRQTSQFLHDRVQSDLMVVAMKLKSIENQTTEDVGKVISKSIARLEGIRSSDLRNLVQILTPNFQTGGLAEGISLLRTHYASSFTLNFLLTESIEDLSERYLLGIFRITEQCLLNSLVHGPANAVTVNLDRIDKKRLSLKIGDDGPGTDPAHIASGVGSAIIDSWVSILCGAKTIKTSEGNGFSLEVIFPS